ncbi:hypothetical protein E2C01_011525 [Portunus trituberculatus]|uniref:Uncharacterized protein n=1 Tax=Portunus trituberculatus TaxID=210409 RepID=A0A5B7DC71_PORTR|nr:hypothetical protein [Portunus trituberculatus]
MNKKGGLFCGVKWRLGGSNGSGAGVEGGRDWGGLGRFGEEGCPPLVTPRRSATAGLRHGAFISKLSLLYLARPYDPVRGSGGVARSPWRRRRRWRRRFGGFLSVFFFYSSSFPPPYPTSSSSSSSSSSSCLFAILSVARSYGYHPNLSRQRGKVCGYKIGRSN